jgi:hypothetical protein
MDKRTNHPTASSSRTKGAGGRRIAIGIASPIGLVPPPTPNIIFKKEIEEEEERKYCILVTVLCAIRTINRIL